MKICIIGAGYVGLVSAACFADLGNFVWCVDKDNKKINMLNNNEIPIYEPGLKDLIDKNCTSGRKKFKIYDMRNLYSPRNLKKQGFSYYSLGREN